MRFHVLAGLICIAFVAACGWFARAAGPERKFQQGLAYLRANQPEEMRYCLVSIDHRSGYGSQASLLRGWLRLQSQAADADEDYMAIWADLSNALEVRKCRALTLALMGRLLYQGGRFANALNMLNGALAVDPDEIEAHRWLGSALYDVGAMAAATDHLKRVADQEVANARICRLLGLIYRERGDLGQAAAAYDESLKRDPDQPDADQVRIDLARCRLDNQEYESALAALRQCHESPETLALCGLCYLRQGDLQRAKDCVARALQGDAENATALKCLAATDPAAAAELLSQAVARKPGDYQLRERLVETYRALGKEDLADEQERRLGNVRERRAELNALLEQADGDLFDASLRYRIAELAQSLGLVELAESWQKAARMLASSNADAPLPSMTSAPSVY